MPTLKTFDAGVMVSAIHMPGLSSYPDGDFNISPSHCTLLKLTRAFLVHRRSKDKRPRLRLQSPNLAQPNPQVGSQTAQHPPRTHPN
jgi:hypothetical protein